MTVAGLTRKTQDDISHTTAIERHVDALLFHGRQPPFVPTFKESG